MSQFRLPRYAVTFLLTILLSFNQSRACPPCIPIAGAILESVGGSTLIGGASVGGWASVAIGTSAVTAFVLNFTGNDGNDVAIQYTEDTQLAADMEKIMSDLAAAGYLIVRNKAGVVVTILIWESATTGTYCYSLISHQWEYVGPDGSQASPKEIPACIKATIKPLMTSLADWKNSLSEIRAALTAAKEGIATAEQLRRLYLFGDPTRTCADDAQCTQLRREVREAIPTFPIRAPRGGSVNKETTSQPVTVRQMQDDILEKVFASDELTREAEDFVIDISLNIYKLQSLEIITDLLLKFKLLPEGRVKEAVRLLICKVRPDLPLCTEAAASEVVTQQPASDDEITAYKTKIERMLRQLTRLFDKYKRKQISWEDLEMDFELLKVRLDKLVKNFEEFLKNTQNFPQTMYQGRTWNFQPDWLERAINWYRSLDRVPRQTETLFRYRDLLKKVDEIERFLTRTTRPPTPGQ